MQLLISGGYPSKDYHKLQEGRQFDRAFLVLTDSETGIVQKELIYRSKPNHAPPDTAMIFKMGTIHKGEIILPTNTEIVFIDAETFSVRQAISHKTFTDLHQVTISDGLLYIANTGMEMVQVADMDGNIIKEYHLTPAPTWKNYETGTDFRFVGSTKPHFIHVNYVFFIEGEPWCTRMLMRDAVSLHDPSKRIDLNVSEGKPHDGLVSGSLIYFTLTDGHVVIADTNTCRVEEVINLNEISRKNEQLGWCRGLEVRGDDLFVGFTQIRKSKFREYGSWIVHKEETLPARVAHYSLSKKKLINEWPIGSKGAAIFSIERFGL